MIVTCCTTSKWGGQLEFDMLLYLTTKHCFENFGCPPGIGPPAGSPLVSGLLAAVHG